MRILVTGGCGFIGAYLIQYWLQADPSISIINLDKLTYCGDPERLKLVEKNSRYQFVRGDISDSKVVDSCMAKSDAVVHLAAETHVDRSLLSAKDFIDTNFYGTYVLLESARKHKIKKFLTVSTDEVYGSRLSGYFKEGDAMHPTSPYAISKTSADLMTLAYADSHDLFTLVTRGANTYGPFQYPEKVIPLFISNALTNQKLPLYGDGKHIRNWLYVEDHARGILTVFKKGKKGEAYNISSDVYLKNIELTKKILRLLGKPLSLIEPVNDRVGHDRRYAISNAKLKRLGWKESFGFDRAFRDTVSWYQAHESWWRTIKEKSQDYKNYYSKAYASKTGTTA